MYWKLMRLRGACVGKSGAMTNRRGEFIGLRVSPGGYLIFDESDQVIGTLTLAGRVYDHDGRLVTQIERSDLQPTSHEGDLAYEVGGALGI